MKVINLPADRNVYAGLKTGEKVLFNGKLYTARDKAHRLLVDMISDNKTLPFPMMNSVIYYTGPVLDSKTGRFTSAGPTTGSRMDSLTEPLLEAGAIGFIGKGSRSEDVRRLLAKHNAVYFSTIGGAGVYLADRILSAKIIAFPELHTEAVYELIVDNFPCYVAIDSYGNTIYKD